MGLGGFLTKIFDCVACFDGVSKNMPIYDEMGKEGWKVDVAYVTLPFPVPPILLFIKPDGQPLGSTATSEDRKAFQDSFQRARQRLNLG